MNKLTELLRLRHAQVFVSVLWASSYTCDEATWSPGLPDWIGAHVHAFEFYGGVPEVAAPDNLKGAVTKACRYDPKLDPTYQQLATHYGVTVIPAHPYKPKDKAKAEVDAMWITRECPTGRVDEADKNAETFLAYLYHTHSPVTHILPRKEGGSSSK